MPSKQLNDTELISLLNSQYGTKPLVMYYLNKAKGAAGRARVDLANQNPHQLGANTMQMIDAIDMLVKILGDDEKPLPTK
jgi:hypothetical protein